MSHRRVGGVCMCVCVCARDTQTQRDLPPQLCSIDSGHMTEGIPALLCQIFPNRQRMRQHNAHVRDDSVRVCVRIVRSRAMMTL